MSRSGPVVTPSFPPTSRTLLAIFAFVDLLQEVLIPLISLVAGILAGTLFGTVSGWGVFVIAFYMVADRIYRGVIPDDVRGRGFEILFAGCALAFGLVLEAETPKPLLLGTGATVIISIIALTGYVHVSSRQSLFDTENLLIQPLASISQSEDEVTAEIKADLSHDGILWVAGASLFVTATGIVLIFPAFLAGLTARLLIRAYPLPDVLAIFWVAGTAVSRRAPDRVRCRFPTIETRVDLEERLLGATKNATRSIMGLCITLFAVIGAFLAAGLFSVGLQLTFQIYGLGFNWAVLEAPFLLWGFVGVVLSPLFAGGTSLWAWVRQFRRLPAFLDHWNQHPDPREPPVDRMMAAIAIASVQLPLVAGFLSAMDVSWVRIGFGLAWPLSVMGLSIAVYASLHGRPREIGRERLFTIFGVLLQLLSLLFAVRVIEEGITVFRDPINVFFRPLAVMAICLVVPVSFMPDISRFEDRTGWDWPFPVFLFSVGVLSASIVVGWSTLRMYQTLLWALTGACVLGGAAIWIVRYFNL